MDDFLSWCGTRQITWHASLNLVNTDGEGGGVLATQPIALGETCFTVPRKVALSSEAIGESTLAAALSSKHALAFAACDAKAHGADLAPWVAMWPAETEGTWSMDGEAREALRWCDELQTLDADESDAAMRALSDVIAPGLIASGKHDALPSAEAYRWGLGIVSSRAADVIISGEARPTILPLIDMMNHRAKGEANVALSFEPELDAVVAKVIAAGGVAAGEPLTINYGEKDNAQLLHGYGFACRPNPHDAVLVRVPIGSDPLAMQRVAMLPRGLIDPSAAAADGMAGTGTIFWRRGAGRGAAALPALSDDIRVLLTMASAMSIEQMFGAMSMVAMAGGAREEGDEEDAAQEEGSAAFDAASLPRAAWELLVTCCTDALSKLPPAAAPPPSGSNAHILQAAAVALEARRDLLQAALEAAKDAAAHAAGGPEAAADMVEEIS